MVDNAMDKTPTKKRNEQEWSPIFWPKQYVFEDHDHSLEGNMLSDAKLLRYGKQITAMRQKLREYGQTLPILPEELSGNSDMQKYIEKLAIKIHKGYFKPYEYKTKLNDFEVDVPVPDR